MGRGKIVGEKIKALRESKNISLKELAEQTCLSEEQLLVIEQDGIMPSLGPLIKIARVLGVRLGTFLDDDDSTGPVVCRKDKSHGSISFSNGSTNARKHMNYFSLAGAKSGRQMEPFIINIDACVEKDFILSSHEGEEFIYVLEGAIEINYGKEVYQLEEGDSIFYDSIVEHHVHGGCVNGAKILAVVYSPLQ
jgi:transcriptional regulator with XRE-family HTH domain